MTRQIKKPGVIVKNILKRQKRFLRDSEDYDEGKPIGLQIPLESSAYSQPLFLRDFSSELNEKFAKAEYDHIELVNFLLSEKVNPLDIDEYQNLNNNGGHRVRIISFRETSDGVKAQTIKQWDDIFKEIAGSVFPYTIHDGLTGTKSLSVESRIVNIALDSWCNFTNWMINSSVFHKYLQSWCIDVVNGNVAEPSKKIDQLFNLVGSRFYHQHHKSNENEASRATRIVQAISSGLKPLFGSVSLDNIMQESDEHRYGSTHFFSALFTTAYPNADNRYAAVKDLMVIDHDHLRFCLISTIIDHPELAVESLSGVQDKERALKILIQAINSSVAWKDDVAEIANICEEYRKVMNSFGFPDLKGCDGMFGLVSGAERIIYFGKSGYNLSVTMSSGYYFIKDKNSKFKDSTPEGMDEYANKVIAACSFLYMDFLRTNIERNFTGQATQIPTWVIDKVTKKAVEQDLLGNEDLLRTEVRIKKVLSYGVSVENISSLKLFKKMKSNIIENDFNL